MKADKQYLKLKDYSVSGEPFELLYDASRELLYTTPSHHNPNFQTTTQTQIIFPIPINEILFLIFYTTPLDMFLCVESCDF